MKDMPEKEQFTEDQTEQNAQAADNKLGSSSVSFAKRRRMLYRTSLCAIFIALAVVAKFILTIKLPLLGSDGLRIGLAGVFTAFPAILCGPIYGGIASAASDLLGYIIKPDGAYIPWLTLTAFAGGVLKGLIWRLFSRKRERKRGIIVAAALILVGALGIAAHISLVSDGILMDLTADQTELATRGRTEKMENSAFSDAVLSLAKYNNDVFTVKAVPTAEEIYLPSEVSLDGWSRTLTKIGGGAFAGSGAARIVIPKTYSSIDDAAFGDIDIASVTIVSEKGSKAADFAKDNGLAFEEASAEELAACDRVLALVSVPLEGGGYSVKGLQSDGYTVDSSDAYRKNLSGYISFSTVGLEMIAVFGGIYLILEALIVRFDRRHSAEGAENGEKRSWISRSFVNPELLKITLACVISGVVITTVNTKILQLVMTAWNGRAFIILWIPRVLEELVVCMVQAFLISLLYGVYMSTVGKRTDKILGGEIKK